MSISKIPKDHPTSLLFLDESGSISNDRFFAVGCLRVQDPAVLLRSIQLLRDRSNFYREFKFTDVRPGTLELYKSLVTVCCEAGVTFSCFVADRDSADPVKRFGTTWAAYEKLATQLVISAVKPAELVMVMADNYSTPADINFEQSVKTQVNRRLGRLAAMEVIRLDSKSSDALQAVDVLTSAVAYEFRATALASASTTSPKFQLSEYVRSQLAVASFVGGCTGQAVSVRLYEDSNWRRRRRRGGQTL